MAITRFTFPPDTLRFLGDIRRHNERSWFEANRSRYETGYVEPAKAFVAALAPALQAIVPGIKAEPRVLGSIFRINRDTRFTKDKRPYKDHLDFWFWEGDRKAAPSGLFARLSPDAVVVGAGAHGFAKNQLARYRAAVEAATTGAELAAIVEKLEHAGYEVGGQTYARTPRGFAAGERNERLLRHSALFAHDELPASTAISPTLVTDLVARWRAFAPLHRWLVSNV
jgi:uncharacterized protein (TIGR02453 family)